MKQKSSTRLVLICGLPARARRHSLASSPPRFPRSGWIRTSGRLNWSRCVGRRVSSPSRTAVVGSYPGAPGPRSERDLGVGPLARVERDEKRLGARALGVGVELHYLDAPLEELIERAQRRNASGEWSASPMTRAHFEGWQQSFKHQTRKSSCCLTSLSPKLDPTRTCRGHGDRPEQVPGSGLGDLVRSRDSRRLREQRDAGVYQGRARTRTLHTTWQFSLRASTTMRGMATCSSAATISRTASASSAPPSPCFW